MSVRIAKHRIEMRINGKPVVLMPGDSYDFDPVTEQRLDERNALQAAPVVQEVKVQPTSEPQPKAKRGRKKGEDVVESEVDELDN